MYIYIISCCLNCICCSWRRISWPCAKKWCQTCWWYANFMLYFVCLHVKLVYLGNGSNGRGLFACEDIEVTWLLLLVLCEITHNRKETWLSVSPWMCAFLTSMFVISFSLTWYHLSVHKQDPEDELYDKGIGWYSSLVMFYGSGVILRVGLFGWH